MECMIIQLLEQQLHVAKSLLSVKRLSYQPESLLVKASRSCNVCTRVEQRNKYIDWLKTAVDVISRQ